MITLNRHLEPTLSQLAITTKSLVCFCKKTLYSSRLLEVVAAVVITHTSDKNWLMFIQKMKHLPCTTNS